MSNKSEKGIKWWIRYVIIPFLVGGGGLISLIIVFMQTKDSPRQITEVKSSQLSMKQGVVGNISTKNGSVYIYNENLETDKISKPKGLVSVAPEKEINGKSGFFKRDYGTLAILPDVRTHSEAVNADTFLILSPGKQHRLKELNPPVWLQFNHHLSDTNGKRRHLGVLIVTFGNMGSIMPLEVYRNKKWVRPQNSQILGQFSEVVGLPWQDFKASVKKWSSPGAKLEESDRVVKGPWQAIPEGGNKISWEFRKFWLWAADQCQKTAKSVLDVDPNFDNVKVSARLIRYSPTPSTTSKSPVIFDIRSILVDEVAIFIAIYALDDFEQDMCAWYWVTNKN